MVASCPQFLADGVGQGMVVPHSVCNSRADCLGLRRTTHALMLALHRTVDPEPCDGSRHHQTGGATGVLCQSEGEEMPQAVGSWRRVAAGLRCSPRVADTDAGIVGWVDTGVQAA